MTGAGLLALAWANQRRGRSRGTTQQPRAAPPGWIARHRAAGGLRHPKAGAALGYGSAVHKVGLSDRELDLGGLILGTKGSGKTYALALLIEALAWQGRACVVLDPKPSRDLAAVVAAIGGEIWTLGGRRQWDALPDEPSELANQLVEVLPVDARMKVYRDAARLWVLVAGQALLRRREHPTVERLAALCRPGALRAVLKAEGRLDDLPKLAPTEQEGVLSLGTSLSILARGVAGPSLGVGADALRLEDAMAKGRIVLLQLAAGPYPEETRMLGAWALRCMLRLLRHPSRCVLLCDEFARLGPQGRAAIELLALGREFGKAVILATQGPSDLGELGPHALDQAAQDAGWLLAFRQGTRDSETASRLLGVRQAEERSWSTGERDTREHVRIVEQRIVPASVLEGLVPVTAYLRGPDARVEPVRMARPSLLGRERTARPVEGRAMPEPVLSPERGAPTPGTAEPAAPPPRPGKPGKPGGVTQWGADQEGGLPNDAGLPNSEPAEAARAEAVASSPGPARRAPAAEPAVAPAAAPTEHEDQVDEDLERVLRRLDEEGEQDGACRLWPTSGCNDQGYPKVALGKRGDDRRVVTVYKWLYEREHGAVPKGWTVDHLCHNRAKARGECPGGPTCKHRRCCELAHLAAKPHGSNVEQRDEPTDELGAEPQASADAEDTSEGADTGLVTIALFERFDKPAVHPRTVSLDDLVDLLTTFDELASKRQARCWSPTQYADGAHSRRNDGVASVSALVFDLDRVPPDEQRLAGVCWIGHTTWSHRPEAPRWRVVIPLARPVPAEAWGEVWRRARAILCPEADPSCKDASRQYYLPSRPPGVVPEASYHEGPLLDVATLPPLSPEPTQRPELPLLAVGAPLREATDQDRERAAAYMDGVIRNLAKATQPGRNNVLNGAAWTLGHWVAAGALDQVAVEDALFAAAEQNGLVADDGPRQCWATIRSGLSKGLLRPIDLDADDWSPVRRRRRRKGPLDDEESVL